ncbi:glycogen/starch/alpha-glucan phosphorylase [Desulfovermiculus halophilus]|uniref:glycogen/starch/alpha-glucan phosphorylase n=1 Tax=Desulfovermiculus halophilus TaxID=339722 RepID=UPI00048648C2|nr:glycogen/starch/alpha-glucan phosphorylase [Desulfovermiculus halophilus]
MLRELGCDPPSLKNDIIRHIRLSLGKRPADCSDRDYYLALSYALRDRMLERMLETEDRYRQADAKSLYYLSMEYLIGRSLGNNMINLGLFDACHQALTALGVDLEEVREQEVDAGLGNGGLGRLAACFIDSLASLHMPGFGYGIHYEFGLFKQIFDNGWQKEKPDHWLDEWTPLELPRPDQACYIPVYGRVEDFTDHTGQKHPMWLDWNVIVGVPYDIPIVGYGGQSVNYLRLFAARPSTEFDISIFNAGDYFRALEQKIESEKISKILYPSDTFREGKELRLLQEYFLVACSLRDIVRRYLVRYQDFKVFSAQVAIQLNDTHPALAVAELMRILVDEYAINWTQAFELTRQTLAYTNHTLLPEALETWPVDLLEQLLPRHMQIIYDINAFFLEEVDKKWPGNPHRKSRMSLIQETPERMVRMAHLAIVGSHATNGVSVLHTELLKSSVVSDFYELWPERFSSKTNGITQRRWLLKSNPLLADLITQAIGSKWITDLDRLQDLEPLSTDTGFQDEFLDIKRRNKQRLCALISETAWVEAVPDAMFDIHAKRIHEYKRQLLFLMAIIHEYLQIVEDGVFPSFPKTCVFAGKAAPGYTIAKRLIKLINSVGQVINSDPRAKGMIKLVFVPDYRVSIAEKIIPAATVSEQISTAGKEASGTGNMKFALNGALTLGTLDGANIEIQEEVGQENIYIFGLTSSEIAEYQRTGGYNPHTVYEQNPRLRRVLQALSSDRFCPRDPGLFHWLLPYLMDSNDQYFQLADFESYIRTREHLAADYTHTREWTKKAILNIARIGRFSSDRTIREYARDIWDLHPVPPSAGGV